MPGQAIVTINDNQWAVEVASTQGELMSGLRGRTSLAAGTGMLFILPSLQQVTVTTQGMNFPIDIIFIANNTVLDVASSIQPGYDVTEETPCDMFLEVNAGEAAGVKPKETELKFLPQAKGIKTIDARGMSLSEIDKIERQYPPNLYRSIGVSYSHLTTDKDITEFRKRAIEAGAVVIIIQEYGQHAYVPIAEKGLKAKWYDRGVEAGKTDAWMDVENTIKETAGTYPGIKDPHELVWTDIDLWEQTSRLTTSTSCTAQRCGRMPKVILTFTST